MMKMALVVSFVIVTSGCTSKPSEKQLLPDDYYFPDIQIGSGKTMVYVNPSNSDTTYLDLFHKGVGDISALIQRSYNRNTTSDSVILLNHKTTEYYINPLNSGSLWKADRLSDDISLDGNKILNRIIECEWKKDTNYVLVKGVTEIVKDTILPWQGKLYETIITKTIIETFSNFLKTPSGNQNFTMENVNYYSKNIGITKSILSFNWGDKSITKNLLEIRDLQK